MNEFRKNLLEWGVFALGCFLVAGAVGFLVWDLLASNGAPPTLEVRLGTSELRGGQFVLPVTVFNRGSESAEQVQIEVVLEISGGRSEKAGFQIAYVPRHASREGWVTFDTNPADAERIAARAVGYQRP